MDTLAYISPYIGSDALDSHFRGYKYFSRIWKIGESYFFKGRAIISLCHYLSISNFMYGLRSTYLIMFYIDLSYYWISNLFYKSLCFEMIF